jgi:DNA-binding GntR family transcriptional regulator
MGELDGIRKIGKAEAIYEQLKSDIENGVFAPGQALGEVMLVERTGASRTPVREALRRLAAEGLVDFTPRIGASVARVSLQGARDLFEFRMVLEPAAMRLVAERARHETTLRRDFLDLAERLDKVASEPQSPSRTARFYELAEDFDRRIVAATPNALLARAVADLRPHTVRLRRIAHTAPERMEVSLVEHQQMCRDIVAGDADAAAASSTHHLQQTVATIFDALLHDGGRPGLDRVELGR